MTTTTLEPERSTPVVTPDHILQTGLAFWASKTLLSAVEMEVFTELGRIVSELQNESYRSKTLPA
jgi:hypothetical protein